MNATAGKRRPLRWLAVGGVLLLVLVSLGTAQDRGATTRSAAKPEHARVVQMPGLLREARIGGQRRSTFRTMDGGWSAVLLPNQILAALEDRKGVFEGQLMVLVTGVVTEYRGRNYLLLTAAKVRPAPVIE